MYSSYYDVYFTSIIKQSSAKSPTSSTLSISMTTTSERLDHGRLRGLLSHHQKSIVQLAACVTVAMVHLRDSFNSGSLMTWLVDYGITMGSQ
jgi:hypothetical protein